MVLKVGHKEWFVFIISILLLTDIVILLNIPFFRQIFGFLFLTILSGLLILKILKLNKLEFTEKFVLSVGLSISFLMFFGLLINNFLFSLGYETPLSTISLLILFNLAFIILAIVGYKANKNAIISLPNLNLTTSEKAFLVVPVMFPALSIFGMRVMNLTNNNIILMFLLFLISAYLIFVGIFNHKFPERLYPVVILLTSISVVLLMALRSNHLIGWDTHGEYYLFQTTLDNLHWRVLTIGNPLDACLSISTLPTIYQSISNINPEYLFKILYPVLYSISPLAIYVLSKRYIGESYGFLAACLFTFQVDFVRVTANSRTSIAILFFALSMMVLFNDKIDPLKKRILFITFMASCMVSHYSTTYIFFFIMLGAFVGIEILSRKFTFKKVISLTFIILFYAFIFFWYSQVTETAFVSGIDYVEQTIRNLNKFFIDESRGATTYSVLGKDIMQKGIPHLIEFIFTWIIFVFIGIGIATLIRRYKEMSFPERNFKKSEVLKDKFEVTYFVATLMCSGLLLVMVMLPYVSQHYSVGRVFAVAITILSVFFVIGGITLSKNLSLNLLRNVLSKTLRGKKALPKKQKEKNGSEVRAYLIILLVLIPYFFCVTGVTYEIFGYPRWMILDAEGEYYDTLFVHDQESYSAKWLKAYGDDKKQIYTDSYGNVRLTSQGNIPTGSIDAISLAKNRAGEGYIYLRYYNVVNGKLLGPREPKYVPYNLSDYSHQFVGKNKIYANGGSEVYK